MLLVSPDFEKVKNDSFHGSNIAITVKNSTFAWRKPSGNKPGR